MHKKKQTIGFRVQAQVELALRRDARYSITK